MRYPLPLQRLIEAFLFLPGVGRRTATKFAYQMVRADPRRVRELSQALLLAQQELRLCELCRQLSDNTRCPICANTSRDATQLCVVADDKTIMALEQTGAFHGLYFVLGGILDPVNGVEAALLPLPELLKRASSGVNEVLLAFDGDLAGDTTTAYLKQELRNIPGLAVSALARGVSTGTLLEYADELTLTSAIEGRKREQKISAP